MAPKRHTVVTLVTRPFAGLWHSRAMRSETGQATIEWVGLILVVALGLAAAVAVVPLIDGRMFGGFLSHRIVCAVRGSECEDLREGRELTRAYGAGDAELVRRFAPGLVYEPGERQVPVDFRECRKPRCARTPDDRDLDVHRSDAGRRVTIARGAPWAVHLHPVLVLLPGLHSTVLASDKLWKAIPLMTVGGRTLDKPQYPGFHLDDWEGYEVRLDRRGHAGVRSTSHGGLQYCKWSECRGRFGPNTGWTRVSRGSHSGHVPVDRVLLPRHGPRPRGGGARPQMPGVMRTTYPPRIPGRNLRERTSTPEGQRLVPLETIDHRRYRRLGRDVSPPWEKRLYRHPEEGGS